MGRENAEQLAGERSGRWLARLIVVLIPSVVALMTLSLLWFERDTEIARRSANAAADVQISLRQLRYLDQETQLLGAVPQPIAARIDRLQRSIERSITAIGKLPVQTTRLHSAFASYLQALTQALALRGTVDEFVTIQTNSLDDTRYQAVERAASDTIEAARQRAGSADDSRDFGSLTTLLLGGAALTFFAWRLVHARSERDVTERSERRITSLMANASDVISVVDEHGVVLYQSPTIERVIGRSASDIVGRDIRENMRPEDQRSVKALLERAAAEPNTDHVDQWRVTRPDGTEVWLEAVVRDRRNEPDIGGFLICSRDVTDRVGLERVVRRQAVTDPLTKLPTRTPMQERLELLLERQRQSLSRPALILLGLDRFKDVNDQLGHQVGDQVLVAVAERLGSVMGPGETLARMGGDQFAMLLDEVEPDGTGAAEKAERIAESLRSPVAVGAGPIPVRGTMGIVMAGLEPITTAAAPARAQQMLVEADLAMRDGKRHGRGSIRFYSPALQEGLRERIALRAELDEALARDEFELHYQPIVDLATGDIVGAEALLRWNHPERGLVSPMVFIPIAEETGQIVAIGRWVMETAGRTAAGWPTSADGRHPYVSVNVAWPQVQQEDFAGEVASAIAASGVGAHDLLLEITESSLMEETGVTELKLASIRQRGVRLGIDDFGTGYSSLSYLHRFDIDVLKVDRSFIDRIGNGGPGERLVEAIVRMARSLEMAVVAEGVEELDQARWLRAVGCQFGQGYLFAKPMPAEDFHELLSARSTLMPPDGEADASVTPDVGSEPITR